MCLQKMAGYAKSRGYSSRSYNRKRITRPGGQLTKRFQNKIIHLVQRTQPVQRKSNAKSPSMFTKDRRWRRTVRVEIAQAATTLSYNGIALAEAAYYAGAAPNAPRWSSMKIIGIMAWGINGQPFQLNIDASGEMSDSSFQSVGDGTYRSLIAVDMPAGAPQILTTQTTVACRFTAGTIQFIDFYVEFG